MFSDHSVDSRRILYTPSSFARNSLLYLQEAGSLTALKPHTNARKKLDSYLFFVVTKGEGSLQLEGQSHALSEGSCVFIDCRNAYAHTTGEKLWDLEWVHFDGPGMPEIYAKYQERGGQPVFTPADCGAYLSCLRDLYNIACSEDHIRDMRLNEKLAALLTLILQNTVHGLPGDTVAEVQRYLEAHWAEKISLEELAARFYINKFYLTRLYKKRYGRSIGTAIAEMRITRAKQLLRFTRESIDEIGRRCGFESANYLARIFKQLEGVSPGEYRKMWTV